MTDSVAPSDHVLGRPSILTADCPDARFREVIEEARGSFIDDLARIVPLTAVEIEKALVVFDRSSLEIASAALLLKHTKAAEATGPRSIGVVTALRPSA